MGLHIANVTKRRLRGAGEIVLLLYLVCVIVIAILQVVTGWPSVAVLASSPALLAQGEWWRLVTSALVVQGPAIPQIIAIAVLGTVGIYIGGSWLFWRTAVAGHLLGTLVAYVGFSLVWLGNHTLDARFVTNPDYGVSLIWCAALGAFAAFSWMGKRADWRRPVQPLPAVLALGIMVLVTSFSDDMAAVQHTVAFIVGVVVIATADRSRALHHERRPLRLRTLVRR